MLLMLANAIVLLHTMPECFSDGSFRTPEEICSILASSGFGQAVELLVDATVFAHAVCKYKTILSKRFMWDVRTTAHTTWEKISSFGSIPERNVKCTLAVVIPPLHNTQTITIQTLIEKRDRTLTAIIQRKYNSTTTYPEDVLFDRLTCVAQLLSPRFCLQLLLAGPRTNATPVPSAAAATADTVEPTALASKRSVTSEDDDEDLQKVCQTEPCGDSPDVTATGTTPPAAACLSLQTPDEVVPQRAMFGVRARSDSPSPPIIKNEKSDELKITTDRTKRSIVDMQQEILVQPEQPPQLENMLMEVPQMQLDEEPVIMPPVPTRSANEKYNSEKLLEAICGDGIILSDEMRHKVDRNKDYQGVRNFHVYPSLDGKSSSHADTDKLVIQRLLIDVFCIPEKEVVLVCDTEYHLIFALFMHLDPEKLKNVVLAPALFHIRMHTIQNLMNDPVFLLLIVLPFYYAMGLQKDKNKKKAQDIIHKMRKVVLASDREQAEQTQREEEEEEGTGTGDSHIPGDPGSSVGVESAAAGGVVGSRPRSFVDIALADLQAELNVNDVDEFVNEGDEDGERADNEEEEDINAENIQPEAHQDSIYTEEQWKEILQLVHKFIAQGHRERGTIFTYKDKQGTIINYARCLYLAQLLNVAARAVQHELHASNWAAKLVLDFLQSGLHELAIQPVAEIILNGSGANFVENLHRMTQYLAFCRRDKVVRSLLTVVGQLLHLAEHRLDLLSVVMENIAKLNDNIIELHNSLTQRMLPEHGLHTAADVTRAALLSEAKRDFLGPQEQALNLRTYSSSKGKGEVYAEEVRHTASKGPAEKVKIQAWLKSHIAHLNRLGALAPVTSTDHNPAEPNAPASTTNDIRTSSTGTNTTQPSTPPPPPPPPPEPSFTLAQCLKWGSTRIRSEVQPKYEQYLQKEANKANRAQQRDAQGPLDGDTTQMDKFNIPVLKAFLCFKQVARYSTWKKSELVTYILQNYGKVPFFRFVADNDIHNDEVAKEYVRGLKRAREIQEEQTRARQRRERAGETQDETL